MCVGALRALKQAPDGRLSVGFVAKAGRGEDVRKWEWCCDVWMEDTFGYCVGTVEEGHVKIR